MRLPLGPGSAVLILGPASVWVVMKSSNSVLGLCRCWFALQESRSDRNWEDGKLVAAEKIGTHTCRKQGAIAARAHQEVQPACRQMRIGIGQAHYNPVFIIP